ncbi:CwfJ C-terminus 1-domain-containing protein-like protein [Dipodascopsis uninucleata]
MQAMAKEGKSKILVFGNPGSLLRSAAEKATQINSSSAGPFDVLLLLGEVLSAKLPNNEVDDILNGSIKFCIQTYFYSPRNLHEKIKKHLGESERGQVCENLFCLGRSGVLITNNGIKIAAVSSNSSTFEIEKLKREKNVDILLSEHWPRYIDLLSQNKVKNESIVKIKKDNRISEVAEACEPRYHFSHSDFFWEREPFINGQKVTRYISVAPFGNSSKSKWFYAFNISVPYIAQDTPNLTGSPYVEKKRLGSKYEEQEDDSGTQNWIFGSQNNKRRIQDGDEYANRKRRQRQEAKKVDPSSCFFCLSNPNIAQHFIVSIGEECYITTAKGPLTLSDSTKLGCPGHVIIIPFSHCPTLSLIEDKQTREATKSEMSKYRLALTNLYKEYGYIAATFAISRSSGIHFHEQIVPVDKNKIDTVEAKLKSATEAKGYELIKMHNSSEISTIEDNDFFRMTLGEEKSFYVIINSTTFDLQFGRKVLAAALGLEDRVDWKACVQDQQEETADAEKFKKAFEPFDFSLEA